MPDTYKHIPVILLSGLCTVLVGAFLYLFYAHGALGIGPEQPIPFSHAVHNGVKQIACRYCHPYVADSNFPGIPPVEKCLHCHRHIIAQHPWIQKEHAYFDTQTPTPWVKVNHVPEHVLFNHQRHIRLGLACGECHGSVETLHRLQRKRWEMGECIQCHENRGANLDCWLACHS